jgi:hypothetical protein
MTKTDLEWNDGLTQMTLFQEPEPNMAQTWASIHPCAMLCWCIQQGYLTADPSVMQTLDNYGYKTPFGTPDFETMEKEFKRHANNNT